MQSARCTEKPAANRNAPTLWNAFTTLRGAEDCADSAETWTARCTLALDTSQTIVGGQHEAVHSVLLQVEI